MAVENLCSTTILISVESVTEKSGFQLSSVLTIIPSFKKLIFKSPISLKKIKAKNVRSNIRTLYFNLDSSFLKNHIKTIVDIGVRIYLD